MTPRSVVFIARVGALRHAPTKACWEPWSRMKLKVVDRSAGVMSTHLGLVFTAVVVQRCGRCDGGMRLPLWSPAAAVFASLYVYHTNFDKDEFHDTHLQQQTVIVQYADVSQLMCSCLRLEAQGSTVHNNHLTSNRAMQHSRRSCANEGWVSV
jgi:hypothetical protein